MLFRSQQCSQEAAYRGGSLKAYPLRQLEEEMAFIAFHFHWSPHDLYGLEHPERRRWCRVISNINRKLNTPSDGTLELA